jgi:hypothetical protein
VAGIIRELYERITRPPEEVRADNLRAWRSSIPGVTAINDVGTRERHKVAGVIQNIRIEPGPTGSSIEATIIDGTGEIVAKWLGRPSMSGISLGNGLIMEGTIGRDQQGNLQILNPDYQLIPNPEHG